MSKGRILNALDGSNPLAFLAALGTLRLLDLDRPGSKVALRWIRQGVWRPEVVGISDDEDVLCERLLVAAKAHLPTTTFSEFLGKNITVSADKFSLFVRAAYESARTGNRLTSDFAAAFGSEVCEQHGKDRIEYTDLCFITGSGHQHFIGTMEGLQQSVGATLIRDALFGSWERNKGLSMRWDPEDAAEYAFRWGDPSVEGASAVWGANLLAIHALPLFPTQPVKAGLRTTGFREGGRGRWPEFGWPIWIHPVGLDTVRSLLSMRELHVEEDELDQKALRAVGIEQVFRAPRVRIGQGANFKVSFRPAKAV